MGFLLGSPDDAVIWRGPKKNGELSFAAVITDEPHPPRVDQAVPQRR